MVRYILFGLVNFMFRDSHCRFNKPSQTWRGDFPFEIIVHSKFHLYFVSLTDN